MPPEVAACVVQKYLLPMFEQDNRDKHLERRIQTFGRARTADLIKTNSSKKPHINPRTETFEKHYRLPLFNESRDESAKSEVKTDGTVYGELKLSERLVKELRATKQELAETK